jgi:uncharacterized protein with GYD domain
MHTYFLLGRCTPESIGHISSERTRLAISTIEESDGQIIGLYALLGEYDLVFIVNLPGNREAMETSVRLCQRTGILFRSLPAVRAEQFDANLDQWVSEAWPASENV